MEHLGGCSLIVPQYRKNVLFWLDDYSVTNVLLKLTFPEKNVNA